MIISQVSLASKLIGYYPTFIHFPKQTPSQNMQRPSCQPANCITIGTRSYIQKHFFYLQQMKYVKIGHSPLSFGFIHQIGLCVQLSLIADQLS